MYKRIDNLKWQFGFIEYGNNYTEALIDFYNLICTLLILVIFLIGFWMIYILNNHTFKRNILINKFNLDFILKGKKKFKILYKYKIKW
jgi:hypothetical protein